MRIQVTWQAQGQEERGDLLQIERAIGFDADQLRPLCELPGAVVSLAPGSVGKGAAGNGIALMVEIAEIFGGVASLIQIGVAARNAITWITRRRNQEPACAGPDILGALAAAETPAIAENPDAWYYATTVPLTTSGRAGTDMRDVWASTFVNEAAGVVQVVFFSPTTRHLGTVTVATEWRATGSIGRIRTDAELADQLRAWFGP